MIGSAACVAPHRVLWALILMVIAASLGACSGAIEKDSIEDPVELVPDPDPDPIPDPDPDPDPGSAATINFSASDSVVNAGDSTTLTWSTQNASSCTASGGWSGSRATEGSELAGPLSANTTYTLTCTGSSGGNALVMTTVFVNGVVQLSWVAPTENVDGSALTDLAGYKIYYGVQSGGYLDSIDVSGSAITQFDLTVPIGSYYLAMTALDADGNESAYSNEVVKNSI